MTTETSQSSPDDKKDATPLPKKPIIPLDTDRDGFDGRSFDSINLSRLREPAPSNPEASGNDARGSSEWLGHTIRDVHGEIRGLTAMNLQASDTTSQASTDTSKTSTPSHDAGAFPVMRGFKKTGNDDTTTRYVTALISGPQMITPEYSLDVQKSFLEVCKWLKELRFVDAVLFGKSLHIYNHLKTIADFKPDTLGDETVDRLLDFKAAILHFIVDLGDIHPQLKTTLIEFLSLIVPKKKREMAFDSLDNNLAFVLFTHLDTIYSSDEKNCQNIEPLSSDEKVLTYAQPQHLKYIFELCKKLGWINDRGLRNFENKVRVEKEAFEYAPNSNFISYFQRENFLGEKRFAVLNRFLSCKFILRTVIDGKDVAEVLGEGALAQVLRAYDTNDRKQVAIKTRKDTMAARLNARSLWREQWVLSHVAKHPLHPHICNMLDAGVVDKESDYFYIALEYIRGGLTLGDMISGLEKVPFDLFINLLSGSLKALAHLHSIGVIHRDIKPDNIMVTWNGEAKLSDFNVSVGAHETPFPFAGSFKYIPPENNRLVDYKADVYSLAVTFYALACKRVPIAVPELKLPPGLRPDERSAMIENHFTKTCAQKMALDEISFYSLRGIYPNISDEFIELLNKMARKNPKERPCSYEALRQLCKIFPHLLSGLSETCTWNELITHPSSFEDNRPEIISLKKTIRGSKKREIIESTPGLDDKTILNNDYDKTCYASPTVSADNAQTILTSDSGEFTVVSPLLEEDIIRDADPLENPSCATTTVQSKEDSELLSSEDADAILDEIGISQGADAKINVNLSGTFLLPGDADAILKEAGISTDGIIDNNDDEDFEDLTLTPPGAIPEKQEQQEEGGEELICDSEDKNDDEDEVV